MYKALPYYAALAMMLISLSTLAKDMAPEPVAIVTLENGASVKLNDDFTWEYVFLENQPTAQAPKDTPTSTAPNTPEFNAAAQGATVATVTTAEVANSLSHRAIEQSDLLKSTAKNGVKISYLNSQWDSKGRLGLNFELSSTSPESYVMIELEIGLFADSGQLIKKETVEVWQAIFRMPETYLRKGQTRKSDTFWIEGVDKAQWSKQLLTLKMKEMNSR
ncbi:DUF3157 family protein [Shewanella algidipiscicola]|uniref:DUF3157 family protein n=1 Tax=Shewanella algidipiscicola TaxID=614070 RepID=A0ABQ4PM62_9GAMM|nr:DUF3157 family protein [Shewanella algidipiscicola]GIU49285.1 hypothetical protein TUM4630_27570 [Shewanella algidipiscicola]